MTGLLPDAVRDAILSRSLYSASQSYGVVVLALLLALMVEREVLAITGGRTSRPTLLSAVSAPLLLVFLVNAAVRVVDLLP